MALAELFLWEFNVVMGRSWYALPILAWALVACASSEEDPGPGGGSGASDSGGAGAGGSAAGGFGGTGASDSGGSGGLAVGGSGGMPNDGGSDASAGTAGAAGSVADAGSELNSDATVPSDMVMVPAGAFIMGCDSCDADEAPAHSVMLSAFEIDRNEVTHGEYAVCMSAGACTQPTSGSVDAVNKSMLPISGVSHAQAQQFCAWLSKRLPTEAEWEKAARGTDQRTYPWGNDAPDCSKANTSACGSMVKPVGSLPAGASPYGALDMAGNVWEWVADWYGATAYATHSASDPSGPSSGTSRVYRGGSSGNDASLARASNRASTYNPAVGGSGLGFRCAR